MRYDRYCMVHGCNRLATIRAVMKFKRLPSSEPGIHLSYCPNHEKVFADFKRRKKVAGEAKRKTKRKDMTGIMLRCNYCGGELHSVDGIRERCKFCRNTYHRTIK